jgi:hypothetical protein
LNTWPAFEEFEVAEATYQAAVKAMAESHHHPAPGRARDEAFFVSLCDPPQVGENKSRRAWKLRRLVLAPRGLTGLLNPLSIWHKNYFGRIS